MKTIIILVFFSFLPFMDCHGSLMELHEAWIETGIKERPPEPSSSEKFFDPAYFTDLDELPVDRKERFASKLAELTPLIAAEWNDGQNRESNSPQLGIILLGRIANDEQKVQAFRDLDLYGRMLSDAAHVLATCKGEKGVRILEQYSEKQLDAVEGLFTEAKRNPTILLEKIDESSVSNFLASIIALYSAYHPSGPTAGEALRKKFFTSY